jgi:hypothetical protein
MVVMLARLSASDTIQLDGQRVSCLQVLRCEAPTEVALARLREMSQDGNLAKSLGVSRLLFQETSLCVCGGMSVAVSL